MKQTICNEIRVLIIQKYLKNTSVMKLSEMLNCSRNTVYNIICGKNLNTRGRKSMIKDKKLIGQLKSSIEKIQKTSNIK